VDKIGDSSYRIVQYAMPLHEACRAAIRAGLSGLHEYAEGPAPARYRASCWDYRDCELYASSSTATLRVRLGSTWTPGPMVVETVIFLM
jgi:hypothetical protein